MIDPQKEQFSGWFIRNLVQLAVACLIGMVGWAATDRLGSIEEDIKEMTKSIRNIEIEQASMIRRVEFLENNVRQNAESLREHDRSLYRLSPNQK
jgi:septal ring factor EnvC (AmiA/AmiB activator)